MPTPLTLRPAVPDPMLAPPLRWGVLGPGRIADRWVASVQRHTRQQVVAAGSRDLGRAGDFCRRHGVPRAHGSYAELVADPGVDAVYVATVHTGHADHAVLALEAGKHVLVEKPLAVNAEQGRRIAAAARAAGRLCTEALWTLFLPKLAAVRQVLDDGMLGEVRTVLADHGQAFPPGHRGMQRALAGGPMLDLGTYPVSFAMAVLGDVATVAAAGEPVPGGEVNGQSSAVLVHRAGGHSLVHSTVMGVTPTTASVTGTRATLALDGPFYMPGNLRVTGHDGEVLATWSEPAVRHDALHHQVAEVARCIADGRLDSPLRPLAESVRMLEVMDGIRRLTGETFDVAGEPGAV